MSLTAKQQNLLEEIEIKSLLTRERYYRDSSQWTKLRNSYHPDISRTLIKISWFQGDIDAFISESQKMAAAGTIARHLYQPIEVHFSLDRKRAVSEATGNVSIRFNLEEKGVYELTSWTRFISKLEKVGEEWKMLGLEPIYDRDSIVPVTPRGAGNAQVESFAARERESYSCLAWVLNLRGYAVDPDLAGTDKPETVDKLMGSYFEWLAE